MSALDPAQVLKNILADPEFEADWRETFDKWFLAHLKIFADWLDRLPGFERGAILVLCLLVLAAIAWSVVRGFREGAVASPQTRTAPPEVTPQLSPATQLAAHARALAAAGRLREAARMLQQAVYRALADRDGLPWDASRADWEWVARLSAEPTISDFTAAAQLAAYGTTAPDAGGFEGLWSKAQQWVAT